VALLEGSDACLTPVLHLDEMAAHPHIRARQTLVEVEGVLQPAPAPRFSRTPNASPTAPPPVGADTDAILQELGLGSADAARLRAGGVVF
jgi:alpha-methylacyl-CoA racemase